MLTFFFIADILSRPSDTDGQQINKQQEIKRTETKFDSSGIMRDLFYFKCEREKHFSLKVRKRITLFL